VNLKILGAHNCESQTTRLLSLLIDDCLALDAGGLTSSLSFAAQQKLKAILLTHQHYDHIRDVPAIGMNFYLARYSITVHSTCAVYDVLRAHVFNGSLYSNFLERPEGNPTLRFSVIEPHQTRDVKGYSVLAVPVNHSVPAVGYQVTSPDGKALFYSGDTGPGLAECWRRVSPGLLVIEVTGSNRFTEFGRNSGHLTPDLLKQELVVFQELKGYLPQVITVHMSPGLEDEIRTEIAAVGEELGCPIMVGYEGMQIDL